MFHTLGSYSPRMTRVSPKDTYVGPRPPRSHELLVYYFSIDSDRGAPAIAG